MNNQLEKKVWATTEIIEAFNEDQTDETREAVLTDGVKGLKDYIEDVENPAFDIENIELVDWDVAFRICRNWIERELWRTSTSSHVREYMTYLVQLQHQDGDVIERKSSKSPLTASKIFWRLRQRNEFDGQQVTLVISQPGKEHVHHEFSAAPNSPDYIEINSALPAPFLPFFEDKHSHAARADKYRFEASLKSERVMWYSELWKKLALKTSVSC